MHLIAVGVFLGVTPVSMETHESTRLVNCPFEGEMPPDLRRGVVRGGGERRTASYEQMSLAARNGGGAADEAAAASLDRVVLSLREVAVRSGKERDRCRSSRGRASTAVLLRDDGGGDDERSSSNGLRRTIQRGEARRALREAPC
jgi:hypothetical protein